MPVGKKRRAPKLPSPRLSLTTTPNPPSAGAYQLSLTRSRRWSPFRSTRLEQVRGQTALGDVVAAFGSEGAVAAVEEDGDYVHGRAECWVGEEVRVAIGVEVADRDPIQCLKVVGAGELEVASCAESAITVVEEERKRRLAQRRFRAGIDVRGDDVRPVVAVHVRRSPSSRTVRRLRSQSLVWGRRRRRPG